MTKDLYYILRYYGCNSRLIVDLKTGCIDAVIYYFIRRRFWNWFRPEIYNEECAKIYLAEGRKLPATLNYYIGASHGDSLCHMLYRLYNRREDLINNLNLSKENKKRLVVC